MNKIILLLTIYFSFVKLLQDCVPDYVKLCILNTLKISSQVQMIVFTYKYKNKGITSYYNVSFITKNNF